MCLGLAFRVRIARLAAIGMSSSVLIISLLALGLWFTQVGFLWPEPWPGAIGSPEYLRGLCIFVTMGAFFLAGLRCLFDPAAKERFRKKKTGLPSKS